MFRFFSLLFCVVLWVIPANAQQINLHDGDGNIVGVHHTKGGDVYTECLLSVAAAEGFECPTTSRAWRAHDVWISNFLAPFSLFNQMSRPPLTQQERDNIYLESAGREPIIIENNDQGGTVACVSCHFMNYFTAAMLNFSLAVFLYFQTAFVMLAPVLLIIWITWRGAMLFFAAGEDGEKTLKDLSKTIALFFMIFLFVITPTSGGVPFAWNVAAERTLQFGTGLNSDLQAHMTNALGRAWAGGSPPSQEAVMAVGCENVGDQMAMGEGLSGFDAAKSATPLLVATCRLERFHALGMALGLFIGNLGFHEMGKAFELSTTGIPTRFRTVVRGLIQVLIGAILIVIFFKSLIWFLYAFLDVLVKISINAALTPVLLTAYLFKASKSYAMNSFRALVAAIVQLLALAIIMSMGFFLLMQMPEIYQMTHTMYGLKPLTTEGPMARFGEMLFRANTSPTHTDESVSSMHIPFNLSTFWLLHMIGVGLLLNPLAKKLMKFIEDLFMIQGGTAMADAAEMMFANAGNKATKAATFSAVVPAAMKTGAFIADKRGTQQNKQIHAPNEQKPNIFSRAASSYNRKSWKGY